LSKLVLQLRKQLIKEEQEHKDRNLNEEQEHQDRNLKQEQERKERILEESLKQAHAAAGKSIADIKEEKEHQDRNLKEEHEHQVRNLEEHLKQTHLAAEKVIADIKEEQEHKDRNLKEEQERQDRNLKQEQERKERILEESLKQACAAAGKSIADIKEEKERQVRNLKENLEQAHAVAGKLIADIKEEKECQVRNLEERLEQTCLAAEKAIADVKEEQEHKDKNLEEKHELQVRNLKEEQECQVRNLKEHLEKAISEMKGLMPAIDKGWTVKWREEFPSKKVAPCKELPPLLQLSEFIQSELPIRIAIHELVCEKWMNEMKMHMQSTELMEKIFITSNTEPCVDFLLQIASHVIYPVAPGITETLFISFWDDIIHNNLNYVLHDIGHSDRNSSNLASTGSNRPDFLFIVNSVCVFRGEEKAPGNMIEIPRGELTEKLIWSYGNVPYLFGYAAIGFNAQLYAITSIKSSKGNLVHTTDLGLFKLCDVAG